MILVRQKQQALCRRLEALYSTGSRVLTGRASHIFRLQDCTWCHHRLESYQWNPGFVLMVLCRGYSKQLCYQHQGQHRPTEMPVYQLCMKKYIPDSKVHGTNMGPIWGWQDPGGPHGGPMKLAIWDGHQGDVLIASTQEVWLPGCWFNVMMPFYQYTEKRIVDIRRSYDRLISKMRFPILVRLHFVLN